MKHGPKSPNTAPGWADTERDAEHQRRLATEAVKRRRMKPSDPFRVLGSEYIDTIPPYPPDVPIGRSNPSPYVNGAPPRPEASPWRSAILYALAAVLLGLIAALLVTSAHAQGCRPETPSRETAAGNVMSTCTHSVHVADTWDGWDNHVLWSAGIATAVNLAVPTTPFVMRMGMCLIPGHVHELAQRGRPGLRYSEKDMVSNLAGCAAGMLLTDKIRVTYYPGYLGAAALWRF